MRQTKWSQFWRPYQLLGPKVIWQNSVVSVPDVGYLLALPLQALTDNQITAVTWIRFPRNLISNHWPELLSDRTTEPAMASIKDKRGEVSWQVGRSCSTQILLQYTEKYASESLQSLITTREFQHSWGQNSIVIFAFLSYATMHPYHDTDCQNQWLFHHRQ